MIPSVSANICLLGPVSIEMVSYFQKELSTACQKSGSLVVEISTTGGEAECGRRLACEVALARKYFSKEIFFLGKTAVYSAGVTFMAEFPVSHRFLTEDAVLLVHERKMDSKVRFNGATSANIQIAENLLAQLKAGQALERTGFKKLVAGSKVSEEEATQRAKSEWYISSQEALEFGLVAGIV